MERKSSGSIVADGNPLISTLQDEMLEILNYESLLIALYRKYSNDKK